MQLGKLMVMEKWCAFQRMKAFLYGYLKGKQRRLSQERYLEILQKIKEKNAREKNKKASRDAASVTRSVPVFWLYDRGTRDTH